MDLTARIKAGAANPPLLFALARDGGALRGLEPGHSRTMMAAHIIATRGTAAQAVLLGLSVLPIGAIGLLLVGSGLLQLHAAGH